ncbi:MAG: ABC transporter permease [Pseudomonadaceae bacterium]|nr:ABC transporter permease [Pseudomonadaceae bacterium]
MPRRSKLKASVSLWLALRYLFARRGHFAAFITWASLIGLTLGVAILVVVVSVMNGFDATLKSRILGTVPHIVLHESDVDDARRLVAGLPADAVSSAFEFFEGQGMITRNGGVNPVAIHGVDAQALAGLAGLADSLGAQERAEFLTEPRSLLLGAPLARHLSLLPGDTVTIIFAGSEGGRVMPRFARFTLAGLFEVGAEIDYSVVFVRLDDLVESGLAGAGDRGYRLVLSEPLAADRLAADLRAAGATEVADWSDAYGEFFRAVRLEKAMMFVLLTLVVAIAAFNIVSSQTMLVNQKRGEIAILMTIGASPAVLVRTFALLSILLCSVGIALGLALGVLLAASVADIANWVESAFGFTMLAGTYFDRLPVDVQSTDLVIITGIAAVLTLAACARPALSTLKVNPVQALHRV